MAISIGALSLKRMNISGIPSADALELKEGTLLEDYAGYRAEGRYIVELS